MAEFLVLFANPDSQIRRMNYMQRMDVCRNRPVAARLKANAARLSEETARTIVRNLRARGFDAACEQVNC